MQLPDNDSPGVFHLVGGLRKEIGESWFVQGGHRVYSETGIGPS